MPKLDPLRRDFGRGLALLSQRWRRDMDRAMRRFALTDATWRPLFFLGRYGDGLTQRELAAALLIEGPSLVRLIDALERQGLVCREHASNDRRLRRLRLTDAGRAVFAQVDREYDRLCGVLLGGVSDADLRICADVLARVDAALATHLPLPAGGA